MTRAERPACTSIRLALALAAVGCNTAGSAWMAQPLETHLIQLRAQL